MLNNVKTKTKKRRLKRSVVVSPKKKLQTTLKKRKALQSTIKVDPNYHRLKDVSDLVPYKPNLKGLAQSHPHLWQEWDVDKNKREFSSYTRYDLDHVHWICDVGHEWTEAINSRIARDSTKTSVFRKELDERLLSESNPDLIRDWADERDMEQFTKFSSNLFFHAIAEPVLWRCDENHRWWDTPVNRTKKQQPAECPHPGCNMLDTTHPLLFDEWADPHRSFFTHKASDKDIVQWKCSKSGHLYKEKISNRTKAKDPAGCPTCPIEDEVRDRELVGTLKHRVMKSRKLWIAPGFKQYLFASLFILFVLYSILFVSTNRIHIQYVSLLIYHSFLFFMWLLWLLLVETVYGDWAVVNTWPWAQPAQTAATLLNSGSSAVKSAIEGVHQCELLGVCDSNIGYGGSPDEDGNVCLDAMILDGSTFEAGAVGSMCSVRDAIYVAEAVMFKTTHTFLVGDKAVNFARNMGIEVLETRTQVPNPSSSCGPYYAPGVNPTTSVLPGSSMENKEGELDHDTVGMVTIDTKGRAAVATTTNGATNKVPGRVGDSPIIGSGGYASSALGGCTATGDGDVMMRFLPAFYATLQLATKSPTEAAQSAIDMIKERFAFDGGVVCLNSKLESGCACQGWKGLNYTYASSSAPTPDTTYRCECGSN